MKPFGQDRIQLDDIQSYNVLFGTQRQSVLKQRAEEREKPLDPETIERRVQRSRNAILARKDKTKFDATTSAEARLKHLEIEVERERESRLFEISQRKDEALLKLNQMYAREEALIESTFVARQTEYDLIAQQWSFEAEKHIFHRKAKEEDEAKIQKLSLAEQMLQEDRENLKQRNIREALDDPLRILGMRTRMPGESGGDPDGQGAAEGASGEEGAGVFGEEKKADAQGQQQEEGAEGQPQQAPVQRRAFGAMIGASAITTAAAEETFDPIARRADRLRRLEKRK